MVKIMKKWLNQKGFTLAEGMVTAGLLGIVSLAMLQGLKEDSKTKTFSRMEDDVQAIMGTINNVVKDNEACTSTFKNLNLPPSASVSMPASSKFKSSDGSDLNSPLTDYGSVAIGPGIEVGPGITLNSVTLSNYVHYFQLNKDFQSGSTAESRNYGSAELTLSFALNSQDGTSRRSNHSILVNIKKSLSNNIEGCINPADLTALQLKKQMCAQKIMGINGTFEPIGSFDSDTGDCRGIPESLKAIGTQLICRELGGALDPSGKCIPLGGESYTCPSGFKKFNQYGDPICL